MSPNTPDLFHVPHASLLRFYLTVTGFAGRHKESACNAGDLGSIPGSERSPGEGKGNPLHYSCLENSMDRGGWRATVHRATKSQSGLIDQQSQPLC